MSFDFSKIPSQAPPEGVTSNFENPYSLAVLPRGFIYATLPPMVVFLGLRFYTRIKISRKVGIDDCEFLSGMRRLVRTNTDRSCSSDLCALAAVSRNLYPLF